ncbi:hypothetical protein N665_0351s0004 [Sinapis alba]|nr:hypothetical protein N665_0351s0004 [Sinapis alba]
MEGDFNWKPNEQGRDSLANNTNDWRSTHETDLRKRIIFAIVEKLQICFPKHSQNDINNTAFKFEGIIYGMATDKSDYLRKISEKIMVFDKKFRSVQSGSSISETNTSDPAAQALNQGQSLPTSFPPYMQTPTSQQWFPQNNIYSNLYTPESSGFSTQVPITVSAAQNLNIQMGEGVHSNLLTSYQRQIQGRQQHLTQHQQQPQSSSDIFQCQVDQQLLKEKIHHLQPPYMQQHAQQQQYHQQSLFRQPFQQQLNHHTSLSTIQQSFPQSSSLSSLTSSGQQNSQYLPRHQFPTQRVYSSHQQQMYVPSQEQKQQEYEQLISQLMNGQVTHQNHLTSLQNNWEQQNNIASFQEMGQQNSNLRNMHLQQHLYSHSNLASQQQTYMPGGQSYNFNVYESSLLGTQGQEVGQSQPMMLQQYQPQQPQNRIFQQHLNDTQRFQAAGSLRQTQNIKGLKEKYLPVLSTLLQKVSEKLGEVDSLPQQNMQHEPIEKLRAGKLTLELVIMYLNVRRDNISESHRDRFLLYEEQVLRFTKNHQTVTLMPMQHQQSQSGHNQVHVSQSLDNDQMNSRLMPSHQNGTSSHTSMPCLLQTRPEMEPKDENNIMSTNLSQSSMFHQKQFHHLQMQHQQLQSQQQQQQQPETNQQQPQIQNHSSPQLVDQQILPTTFHNSTGTSSQFLVSPFVAPSPTLPLDITSQTESYKKFSSLESEADSTASSGSKVHKIEPGCALLQEIKDINGSLVETVVNICNDEFYPSEVTSGTIVTCSYSPVALSDTLEAHYKSGHISQIQPLRLLVPVNYPYSPILLLEKVPSDASLQKYDDLSARTRSKFSLSMKEFSEPMSLKEIAQVWDVCARETMAEYAERHGGGTFSSQYGHWESVLGAS